MSTIRRPGSWSPSRPHHVRSALLVAAAALTGALAACGGAAAPSSATSPAPIVEAPPDRSRPPAPGEARPFALPAVSTRVLANGMEVVAVRRPGVPTFAARLQVRAGRDATQANVAVAELTATLLRDGTASRDATELSRFVAFEGLTFDTSAGAESATVAVSGLGPRIDAALEVMSSVVATPRFDARRVDERKEELAAALRLQAAQPGFHRERIAARALYGDHPYARRYPTPDEVAGTTREDVVAFHARAWTPNRARLILVGDLPDDIDARIDRAFAAWSTKGEPWVAPPAPSTTPCNEAWVVLRPDSQQTSIAWVGRSASIRDEVHPFVHVANHVLGGGPSARLFMNLREAKSYTYGAYSRLSENTGAAIVQASSDVRNEVTGEALSEFVAEFERIRSEAIPDAELAAAKSYLTGVFPIQLETNAALAEELARVHLLGSDASWLTTWRERVAATDGARVGEAASLLFDPARLALVMVGDEAVVLPAARAHASRVRVHDLEGREVRVEPGALPSTCPGAR